MEENVILKLEKLAKLNLSAEERLAIKGDLEGMIKMINKLQEVDTEDASPLIYMHSEKNVLREDKVDNMLDRNAALKNAPKRIDNYIAVPKIIKKQLNKQNHNK